MSISGGVKFFEQSACREVDGALIEASSGDSSSSYAIDQNPVTKWRGVGGSDLITETITVTFPVATVITRLLLLDINWKDFNVMYDVAGTWTHFASVRGLDAAKANVTETAFADESAYYEFTEVTTSAIRIQVLKTQTADQQKYCSQIIATSELGTLAGYPEISNVEIDRNSRVKKTLSGRYVVQKSEETVGFGLRFGSYPSASEYHADLDLMLTLHDREDSFLVWLCGGRRGSTYFRYTLRGYRLKDVFQMQVTKSYKLKYAQSVYINGVDFGVDLEESI